MSILKEFKAFAVKGNVLDLAVAVIVGAAFGKIVTAFVADIIMPPIGALMGGVNFSDIKIVLSQSATLNIGDFIQTIVDFLIIAGSIFLAIKAIGQLKQEKKEEKKVEPTKEEILLAEIRDLLKNKKEIN